MYRFTSIYLLVIFTIFPSIGEAEIQEPTHISPGSPSSPGPSLTVDSPTLSWTPVSGASYYSLGVRDLDTNELIVDVDNYSATSYSIQIDLVVERQYRWNVRACSELGDCSNFTDPWYFQIAGVPEVPILSRPGSANPPGEVISNTSPRLRWSGSSAYFNLGVRDLTTGALAVDLDNYESLTYITPELEKGHSYRWGVQACNDTGCSEFSDEFYFQIEAGVTSGEADAENVVCAVPAFEGAVLKIPLAIHKTGVTDNSYGLELSFNTLGNGAFEAFVNVAEPDIETSDRCTYTTIDESGEMLIPRLEYQGNILSATLTYVQILDSSTALFLINESDIRDITNLFTFPLRGYTPYTVPISGIMDHHAERGMILAYNGDRAGISSGHNCLDWNSGDNFVMCDDSNYFAYDVVGFGYQGANFLPEFEKYDSGVPDKAREYLFYDGHTGYDYSVGNDIEVFPIANGVAYYYEDENNSANDGIKVVHASTGHVSYYLHLKKPYSVADGEEVSIYSVLGETAQNHLHLSVKAFIGLTEFSIDPYGWKDGNQDDPLVSDLEVTSDCLWADCID